MQSGELRWVRMSDTDFVAQIKAGLEAASFTNEDFILTGCNPNLVFGAEKKLPDNNRRRKQPIGRNPLRRLAKEAKRAARQARRAARKAEVASKKIEKALKNKKRQ
jgi:hypothetical protein